jgi:hypothetical protein
MHELTNSTRHDGRPRRLGLRAVTMTVALAAGGLLLTACTQGSNSPGVASLGANAGAGGSASPSATPGPLAYSQCMRSHGVPSFPDPDAQGRIALQAGPGSALDPGSTVFQAAQQACQSLQPVPSAADIARGRAAMLKLAQCMRSHGIADFPDPDAQGRMMLTSRPGGDLDPSNPRFAAAQTACQKYAPGGGHVVTQGSGIGGKP